MAAERPDTTPNPAVIAATVELQLGLFEEGEAAPHQGPTAVQLPPGAGPLQPPRIPLGDPLVATEDSRGPCFPDFGCMDDLESRYYEGLTLEQVMVEAAKFNLEISKAKFKSYGRRGLVSKCERKGKTDGSSGSYGIYPHYVVWQLLCIDFLNKTAEYTLQELENSVTWQGILFVQTQRWKSSILLPEITEENGVAQGARDHGLDETNGGQEYHDQGTIKQAVESAFCLEETLQKAEKNFIALMRLQFPFPKAD